MDVIDRQDTSVAQRTQAKILGAAGRCVLREGYQAVRIEGVAREAGITRQTIYNYFPNKASLIAALLESEGRLVNQRARSGIDADAQGSGLLAAAMIALIDAARSDPYFAALLVGGSLEYILDLVEHSPLVGGLLHEYWEPILNRFAADDVLRGDVPRDRIEWWLNHVYLSMLTRPATDLDNRPVLKTTIELFVAPGILAGKNETDAGCAIE